MSGSFSFKIGAPPRPPSASGQRPPTSRASGSGSRAYHHSQQDDEDDSSDDDAFAKRPQDEEITAFGASGATRCVPSWLDRGITPRLEADLTFIPARLSDPIRSKIKLKKEAPLAIPSLANKDWRAEATKNRRPQGGRKREMYIPDAVGSMRVGGPAPGTVGPDGSQGGLGTKDVMNDVAVVGGLAMPSQKKREDQEGQGEAIETDEAAPPRPTEAPATAPETDEQRALRELLSGQDPSSSSSSTPAHLAPIHSALDTFQSGPQDETTAFRSDVLSRPDAPDLDAYARVPVGQFGAALLRGMGWTEGTAASRTGRAGPTEAYVPKSRPAMLGIGAKALKEVLGEEKGKDGRPVRRDRAGEMRFVPLVKKAREGGSGASVSLGIGGRARRSVRLALTSPIGLQTPAGAITNGSSSAPSSSRGDRDRRPDDKPRDSRRDDRDRDSGSHRSSDRDRDRDSGRSRSHRDRSRSPRRDDRDRYRSDRDRESGRSSRREEERMDGGRSARDHRDRDRDRDDGRDRRERDHRDRDRRDDRRRD